MIRDDCALNIFLDTLAIFLQKLELFPCSVAKSDQICAAPWSQNAAKFSIIANNAFSLFVFKKRSPDTILLGCTGCEEILIGFCTMSLIFKYASK